MRFGSVFSIGFAVVNPAVSLATSVHERPANLSDHKIVSPSLFAQLEEASRIVDIAYCVGLTGTGIQKPFSCLSRCKEFENFELIRAWNTGPLLSDSCGYIAVSHSPGPERIIVAFRGTYSISNTLADLSTVPQEYVPYPGDDDERGEGEGKGWDDRAGDAQPQCVNCTVHTGFYTSWLNTRHEILEDLLQTVHDYPTYELTLIGHSLGGAVAALAGLDFAARGWKPSVTTFGEPRIGNAALNRYLEEAFELNVDYSSSVAGSDDTNLRFRRVTHCSDPVPLLPLEEWGYEMHAGEIFISKEPLPPENADVVHCRGAADPSCIADESKPDPESSVAADTHLVPEDELEMLLPPIGAADQVSLKALQRRWGIPSRYKLWQLFFAHRDYFWRIGLCVPDVGWWHGSKDGG